MVAPKSRPSTLARYGSRIDNRASRHLRKVEPYQNPVGNPGPLSRSVFPMENSRVDEVLQLLVSGDNEIFFEGQHVVCTPYYSRVRGDRRDDRLRRHLP